MGVALITPFKEDDSVDYEALLRLVDYQLQNGTDFLCVLGTTAETPTLTKEEKDKIKHLVVERVNGRIPILLGISSNCTRTVVESLKNDDFTGVDAVLVAVPYYNKPSQEGIYQHYKAIAEATDLPVVLYNVPGRTGVNMTAETTLRLARDFNNIIAIKEASGNITQMDDIIKNKPANFDVISGDDGITFPLITLGAVGVISVIGNAFPREFSRMTRLALQGDFANALTIHHKFTELFSLLFVDGNPAGVKAMLNVMGLIENKLRLPLVPTRITTFEKMRAILNELKRQISVHQDRVGQAFSRKDLIELKQAGKKAIFLGIENGYAIGKDISNLSRFRDMGVVYMTLCHNGNNDICDSASGEPEHNGLSDFGKSVVREMNRIGMMVDLSHASEKSFYDALEVSSAPIIASHSSCRAICDHRRNLTDEQIVALARHGGVVQICLYLNFLTSKENTDVKCIVEHINHVVKLVGVDYVGIGSDFDGGGGIPGCDAANELINITKELIRQGYSENDLAKIWGGNFLRVMDQVQRVY